MACVWLWMIREKVRLTGLAHERSGIWSFLHINIYQNSSCATAKIVEIRHADSPGFAGAVAPAPQAVGRRGAHDEFRRFLLSRMTNFDKIFFLRAKMTKFRIASLLQ